MIDFPFLDPLKEFLIAQSELGLALVAFTESVFFPIPPDFLYIPMILSGYENPYFLALLSSLASVLGAISAYAIAYYGGRPLIDKFAKQYLEKYLNQIETFFDRYGSASILLAAFTPIPFKVFTLSAGLAKMPFKSFVIYSILGRAGRFYLVSYILINFGEEIMQNFFKWSLLLILPLLGVILTKYWKKAKKTGINSNS